MYEQGMTCVIMCQMCASLFLIHPLIFAHLLDIPLVVRWPGLQDRNK